MRCLILLTLILMFSASGCSQNDTKGRANLTNGTERSDAKTATPGQQTVNVPSVVGKTLAEAIGILDAAGFKISMTGSGSVIKQQTPQANAQAAKGSTVMLAR